VSLRDLSAAASFVAQIGGGTVMADLQEVDAERRASVAGDAITSARIQWDRRESPSSALTAREGLAAIQFEALLVWTAAANIRNGVELTQTDFDRLSIACQWIDLICDEVL
jgi:hypothetical protein